MLKTFKEFLESKGITPDAFDAMELKEVAKLHTEYNESIRKDINTALQGAVTPEQLKTVTEDITKLQTANTEMSTKTIAGLKETLKTMGLEVEKLKEQKEIKLPANF